jgi:hypothetical protein
MELRGAMVYDWTRDTTSIHAAVGKYAAEGGGWRRPDMRTPTADEDHKPRSTSSVGPSSSLRRPRLASCRRYPAGMEGPT